jgi:hypothetical protein
VLCFWRRFLVLFLWRRSLRKRSLRRRSRRKRRRP